MKLKDPPEKPQALILWEQCQALNLPLVDGGVIDQPHIWLQELAVVIEVEALFSAIASGPPNTEAHK